jgi:hypothetical protein
MRILLGILALCLVLLLLEAPMARDIAERMTLWVIDWATESPSKNGAKSTAAAAETAPQNTGSSVAEADTGQVPGDCGRAEAKRCDILKRHSCGPVSLAFSATSDGAGRCERATILLPPTQVIPLLRRVRCLLVGEDTQVRFSAENYQPQQGPDDGDTIDVRNGGRDLIVYGHYQHRGEHARVTFENIGPGATVVLKCEAFGPA